MANTPQARKRVRQSERRRLRNKSVRSAAKTFSKRVLAAVEAGDADRAESELRLAFKRLDKAAKRRVYHRNTVARKKSRLARLVHGLSARAREGGGSPAE